MRVRLLLLRFPTGVVMVNVELLDVELVNVAMLGVATVSGADGASHVAFHAAFHAGSGAVSAQPADGGRADAG